MSGALAGGAVAEAALADEDLDDEAGRRCWVVAGAGEVEAQADLGRIVGGAPAGVVGTGAGVAALQLGLQLLVGRAQRRVLQAQLVVRLGHLLDARLQFLDASVLAVAVRALRRAVLGPAALWRSVSARCCCTSCVLRFGRGDGVWVHRSRVCYASVDRRVFHSERARRAAAAAAAAGATRGIRTSTDRRRRLLLYIYLLYMCIPSAPPNHARARPRERTAEEAGGGGNKGAGRVYQNDLGRRLLAAGAPAGGCAGRVGGAVFGAAAGAARGRVFLLVGRRVGARRRRTQVGLHVLPEVAGRRVERVGLLLAAGLNSARDSATQKGRLPLTSDHAEDDRSTAQTWDWSEPSVGKGGDCIGVGGRNCSILWYRVFLVI